MKTKKVAKHALFTSVLALVLCVSMLVGTTFAWFTDSVTSGNNIIAAGNLDVELYNATTKDESAKVTDQTVLFDEVEHWEPGVVAYENLTVANVGTLALKYELSMNFSNENTVVDADGNDTGYKLSQVLQIARVEGGVSGDRDAVLAAAKASSDKGLLANYTDSGNLLPEGEDDVYGIVIWWEPGEEDNNWNVNNGKTTSDGEDHLHIDLGVMLTATQLTYENDSFDNKYDADAFYGSYEDVAEGEKVEDVMSGAEAGQPLVMVLSADTTWVTEGHHGENDVSPASSITIDGQGKYTLTATGAGVTPIGDAEAPLTLRNLTVVDESVSYNESAWEFAYLELGGSELTCENVTFADPVMIESGKAIFKNCTFTGKTVDGLTMYGVWVTNGDAEFINCTFEGTRGMKICDMYAPEVGTVVVDGCTFNNLSEKPGVVIDDEDVQDMAITIKNSTFLNCQPGDQSLYVYETDNTLPTVSNNTVLNNATVVNTAADLLALSAKTLTGNNGIAEEATIVINDDIDLGGADFSAIIAQRGDKLTVLGNGHTISNVNVVSGDNDNTTGQAGMFYAYPNSTLMISDLTLENLTVTADESATGYAGAVVGYCEGALSLNNVNVVGAAITGVKSSGAMIGHLSGSVTAADCSFSGTVTLADFAEETAGHYAGKYIGTLAGPATLNNCSADVTVSGNLNAANIGTIYGRKTAAGTLTVDGASEISDGFFENGTNYYIYNAAGLKAWNEWSNTSGIKNNKFWGKTYNLMDDIDASEIEWTGIVAAPDSAAFNGIVFNGNKKTITGLTINGQGLFTGACNGSLDSASPAVFKDVTFDGVTVTGGSHHNGVVWGEVVGDITLENVHVVNSTVTGGCNVGGLVGRNSESHANIKFVDCSVKNTVVNAKEAADFAGASAFLGNALHIGTSCSANVVFEGNNVAEGNTLNTGDGMQGGGIYTTAEWGTATWETPVVVNAFINYNSSNK